MHPALKRLTLLLFLLLPCLLPARAGAAPTFLTGTTAYPDYGSTSLFYHVPVGKTLVVPVAVSGSSPVSYSVTSTNPSVAAVVKTGYPVLTVNVSFSGTTGPLSTLYAFTGGADGGSPYAGLIQSSDGSLYGTTETDGTGGAGTVYQLTTSGTLGTLWSFTGGADGGNPYGSVLQGADGFYGTTEAGGTNGQGTVYLLAASGSLTTLWSFTGGADGANPYCALVSGTVAQVSGSTTEDVAAFFGTTRNGGANGLGTIFSITTTGSLNTLHAFGGVADGANPEAGLAFGSDGNYYGTTVAGGASGAGAVYQLTAAGVFSPLYSFTGGADGGSPYAGVIQGTDGNLYGVTETGGDGYGTVYRITTSGSLTTLHTFTDAADGANPYAPLLEASDGNFYGATETGGTNGYGTLFQVTTSGSFTTLYSFSTTGPGANPRAGLVVGSTGLLYGATTTDGSNGNGCVYQFPLPNAGAFTGAMKFALLRDMAPTTVGYISGLAQAGYYNGLDFFRIANLNTEQSDSFIAQAGDPTETGTGGPGFTFNNEFNASLIFTGEGQLAMANAGIDSSTFQGTNSSQFFITQGPIRSLDFGFTIFGQLITGFDTMGQVMSVPLQSGTTIPVKPVVITSATVSEDNDDAVLLVSASGYVPSGAIKVNAVDATGSSAVVVSGSTSGTGLTIPVSTPNQDSVDDPPYMVPDAAVTGALRQKVTLPVRAVDLEFDDLFTDAFTLASAGATVSQKGNIATVTPAPSSPIGAATIGLEVYQPFVGVDRSNEFDETPVNVFLGTGALTPMPACFIAVSGSALVADNASLGAAAATTFGSFLCSNPGETAADFTASINWGDGVVTSGTSGGVSVVPASNLPSSYAVSCPAGHSYSGPGIYSINVTVTGSNGGMVSYQDTACVSPGPIYPFGRAFTAVKGAANCLVATFVDNSSNVSAADYQATINWGDGSVKTGNGIVRGANGSYSVYGKHQYTCGAVYPVDVTIQRRVNPNESGYAWSTAYVTGLPTRQPPFPQSHITAEIGDPGYNGLDVSEEVTILNSGNVASGPLSLKFYLSSSSDVDTVSAGDIPLQVGGAGSYNTVSIPPGGVIEGSVSNILLPSNINTEGMYIIMEVISSDPVAIHMDYPRVFVDSQPILE